MRCLEIFIGVARTEFQRIENGGQSKHAGLEGSPRRE